MITIDASNKTENKNHTEQQQTDEHEALADDQQQQLLKEQLEMLDDANLLNRF